jgi:hypothetical protein
LIKQKLPLDTKEICLGNKLAKIVVGMNKGTKRPMNIPFSDILHAFKKIIQSESRTESYNTIKSIQMD